MLSPIKEKNGIFLVGHYVYNKGLCVGYKQSTRWAKSALSPPKESWKKLFLPMLFMGCFMTYGDVICDL